MTGEVAMRDRVPDDALTSGGRRARSDASEVRVSGRSSVPAGGGRTGRALTRPRLPVTYPDRLLSAWDTIAAL